jgi:hypothetical protein
MKKIFSFILILFLFGNFTLPAKATYDPSSVPNNHFGMHVVDTSNLREISKLVGDWGYVTFVIQKGERDPKRWQTAFDEMRRLHLIPIIRIASAPIAGNNNIWEVPSVDEIDGWVSFLNSLNWVIKNRYVTIGNEPNHASEWGGQIDPAGYANYLEIFSQKLKASNEDFFIMPAGLDASANNSRETMEESLYLTKMMESNPKAFQYIDGLASHSYPNPDFSGPGDGDGKGTVRTYLWELNYLKFLGVTKNLPVFITETGWTHKTDTTTTDIGPKIETAFTKVWSDKRIIAVTPFIYKYENAPFDTFSWINKEGNYYDFYKNVFDLQKTAGRPIQEYKADILTGIFPKIATVDSIYNGVLFIKNTGQSIWTKDSINLMTSDLGHLEIKSIYPTNIEPMQIGVFFVDGKFPKNAGTYNTNIELINEGEIFNNQFLMTANLIPNLPNLSDILNYIKIGVTRKLTNILK